MADFSDFGCIYCANFHNGDYPVLYEEFVVSGDVLWKYVPISVGGFPNGDLAGVTGICADEIGAGGDFGEMRDILFVERDDWMGATPTQARELFVSYAGTVGLEAEAFTACLDGDSAAERLETEQPNVEASRSDWHTDVHRSGQAGSRRTAARGLPKRTSAPHCRGHWATPSGLVR